MDPRKTFKILNVDCHCYYVLGNCVPRLFITLNCSSKIIVISSNRSSNNNNSSGDPLSPLLFVMSMDEVLVFPMLHLGYQFCDSLVDGFTYDDDSLIIGCKNTRCHFNEN